MFLADVKRKAIFRAICQAILFWQTLRDKLFGGSNTEQRFLQVISQLD